MTATWTRRRRRRHDFPPGGNSLFCSPRGRREIRLCRGAVFPETPSISHFLSAGTLTPRLRLLQTSGGRM